MAENNDLPLSERLRNGETIICLKCHEGHYITDVPNGKRNISHCFYCDKCGSQINIDDSNILVE